MLSVNHRYTLNYQCKGCKYGISAVRGGLYGGYEAEVEIEHIFNQEAHYGNEDYSLF